MTLNKRKNKGFTLLELIISIAIMAIIIAIIAPNLVGVRGRAKHTAFDTQIKELRTAATMCSIDHPNEHIIWSPFASQKADKTLGTTDDDLKDTWNQYLDVYPQDPTRAKGSTFIVDISGTGEIDMTPNTAGD